MIEIVLASDNAKKLKELKEILAGEDYKLTTKSEEGFTDEVEETGTTFEENSLIKAMATAKATGKIAVADDSGLEVDCLGGAPGVYSSRYGTPGMTDDQKVDFLLENIKKTGEEKPRARFVSVITCVYPTGEYFSVRGVAEGTIIFEKKGEGGFGYDPVFVGEGMDKTFSEISAEEKNALSHRGKALRLFAEKFKENLKSNG